MKKTFYSNGKLMITAEYTVLNGAKVLALPTKFGQNLVVEESEGNQISWKSFDNDQSLWFEATVSFENIKKKEHFNSEETTKNTLIEILHEAYLLNPNFLNNSTGYNVTTALTFPRNWGLGTSSTLINNIAQWTEVNAFELLKNSFGGSGYDIANAQNNTPILYWLENEKPVVERVNFRPEFSKNIYFIYLNKKQSSKKAIEAYRNKKNHISETVEKIDLLTSKIITTQDLSEFQQLITQHENTMSLVLETPTVKELYFQDFNGSIKSLGAWGGDFVMAVSEEDPTSYFHKKGFETILTYEEMILKF